MSPRAKVPRPAGEQRAHLLDVALRCFATWGYEGTSVRRIAEEAGVAPGLLYHYFPGKEALLRALFERSAAMVAAPFAEVAEERDARARFVRLLRVAARVVRENREFWQVSYGVRFQHEVLAGLAEPIAAQSRALHAAFATLLGELGRPSPELDAALLFAAVDGVFQHYVLDPERFPLDDVIETLIAHFVPSEAT